ncbi:MAG: Gfo/Idh/MocA family oxidoreductase [Ardenticatenaceae bacterium]|nr:Gfo/Idh/MocA family oxidoreductase [Anaerolineales bacterium]MCB8941901.1 Gfo/Idh/MocA family oxidoreductase [Ardenticatenaceae bacterium]MCB8973015.1 Gfo/Idh/MocA family oxidoreductase [Ardenticatenaceae bacterium]
MSKIRWGLLSTANINRRVIPAIRESARGELVAVASRSQESAQAYADKWDIPLAFGSYEAMLASDAVDAVYIGLPNHLHAEWSIKAMQQGKHVLCEKPFALTLAVVDEMTAVSQQTGCYLAEAFMYRHHPQTKIVGEMMRNGRLGRVTVVRGVFNFAFSTRDNIRLVPEWGGGCLWDVGVYPLSFAQYVMGGPPQRVFGTQWLGESGVDEVFSGQMVYAGGAMAQISSSFCTPFHTQVEIIGTEGRLVLNRPFTGHNDGDRALMFYPKDGESEEIAVPEEELYLGEIEDLHTAVLDNKPQYLTLEETRNHVKTVLALYESARTGQVVSL